VITASKPGGHSYLREVEFVFATSSFNLNANGVSESAFSRFLRTQLNALNDGHPFPPPEVFDSPQCSTSACRTDVSR
jgi:hypothetical protein